MNDEDLAHVLALYFSCCEQAGIEALPLDEARERARRFSDLLEPAFERECRTH